MGGPPDANEGDLVDTSVTALPISVLEDVAGLCAPAAASSASLACRLLRGAFQAPARGVRLYSQRPATDAVPLHSCFQHASHATLSLATTRAACSQEQLDAWLHALQQRTGITDLTLLSAALDSSSSNHPAPTLPGLARLASLRHLRTLVLEPHLCDQHCEEAAACLGQFQLTRLEMPAPPAVLQAVAAGFSGGGLSQLCVLDLTMRQPHAPGLPGWRHWQRLDWTDLVRPMLTAAAAAAPSLRVLALRNVRAPAFMMRCVPAFMMRCVQEAFGPAAMSGMDVVCACGVKGMDACDGGSAVSYQSESSDSDDEFPMQPELWELRSHSDVVGAAAALAAAAVLAAGYWQPDVSSCAFAVSAHILHDLSRLTGPHASVAGLTLSELHCHSLDLSALSPDLRSLNVLGLQDSNLVVTGSAPAVTAVTLQLLPTGAGLPPLVALAAGCPHLGSLTLSCKLADGGAGDWSALALLQGLTTLRLNGCQAVEEQRSAAACGGGAAFCVAWLPPALVTLQLHSMAVSAALPAEGGLLHLLSLTLHNCAVVDLGVFAGACSLHTLEVISSPIAEGAATLFTFQALETLFDFEDNALRTPLPGLLASAAAAAVAAAAHIAARSSSGGGSGSGGSSGSGNGRDSGRGRDNGSGGVGSGSAMLPRLRSLSVRAADAVLAVSSLPHLLQTLSELHLLTGSDSSPPPEEDPVPKDCLMRLAAFYVSGSHARRLVRKLQVLLRLPAWVVGEVVQMPAVSYGSSSLWDAIPKSEQQHDYDYYDNALDCHSDGYWDDS